MISSTQTGAVRCCSFDGGSCKSKIPDCSTLTFSNAEEKCSIFGMRLCTKEELASNICCGTGCEFDIELVLYTKGNVILLYYQLLSKLSFMLYSVSQGKLYSFDERYEKKIAKQICENI